MNAQSFRLEWAAMTDRGSVREHNEDAFVALPEVGVWIVADGMGGFERGEWASELITGMFDGLAPQADLEHLLIASTQAVHVANRTIFAKSQELGARIGSTVVGLAIVGGEFGVFWAGDSRAYLLRGGVLYQVTRDHTQVQELVERGRISADDAATHPMSHVLSKAVGVEQDLELEGVTETVVPGDLFLLCSDGLHGVLCEEEICKEIRAGSIEQTPDRLIRRCLERGANDNVTAIVVQAMPPTILVFGSTGRPKSGDM